MHQNDFKTNQHILIGRPSESVFWWFTKLRIYTMNDHNSTCTAINLVNQISHRSMLNWFRGWTYIAICSIDICVMGSGFSMARLCAKRDRYVHTLRPFPKYIKFLDFSSYHNLWTTLYTICHKHVFAIYYQYVFWLLGANVDPNTILQYHSKACMPRWKLYYNGAYWSEHMST